MARPKPDREKILAAISSNLLANGLASARLRPMAAAAGTSDRLLIYHFGNKEKLIAEVLQYLASDLASKLNDTIADSKFKDEDELVNFVMALMRSQNFKPYACIWLEIVACAARGTAGYVSIAKKITKTYFDWVSKHHSGSDVEIFEILTVIEGLMVLDAANCLRFDVKTERFSFK